MPKPSTFAFQNLCSKRADTAHIRVGSESIELNKRCSRNHQNCVKTFGAAERSLLECDLWRVLHSCLHSIGVRIVIRRVGTVHGAISSAPTSRGERLEDSSNPLIYSQDWNLGRFTLLLAILGREYSQLHFRLAQLRSCRRTFGSDVPSFLTGSSSDDPSPQRRVVEAYWIDLERVLEAD